MRKALVVIVFALFVMVFFRDVIFGNQILLTESPFTYFPWRSYAGKDDTILSAGRVDSFRTYLPRSVELARSVAAGRLPLWNPYIYAGCPALADPQARTLYPLSLLLALGDPARAMGLDVMCHTLIAMIGMYLFLRAIKATVLGSMIGAFAFGLSSFFFTRHGHPTFIASAAWIPFSFFAFETARRRIVRGTLLLAATMAMGFLAGHPRVFLTGAGALVVYAVCMTVEDSMKGGIRRALPNLAVVGVAGLLALLLIGAQGLPSYEYLQNSTGEHLEEMQITEPFTAHPLYLICAAFPYAFGNPIDGTSWPRAVLVDAHRSTPSMMTYCGVGSLLVALGSIVFLRTSRHIRILFILLVIAVGLGTSAHARALAGKILPFMGPSNINRVSAIPCFALAALAGKGLSLIYSGRRGLRRRSACIICIIVALMIAVYLLVSLRGEAVLSEAIGSLEEIQARLADTARSHRFAEWIAEGGKGWLDYEKRQVARGIAFGIACLGLVLIVALPRRAGRGAKAGAVLGFLLVLVADLTITAGRATRRSSGPTWFSA